MQHFANSSGKRLLAGLILSMFLIGFSLNAQAIEIRVSQESSAGAGDFDANVLGTIEPFVTGLTASGFYQYNTPNGSSYNGELNGGPLPISSQSQVFFLNALDGLSLVVVHDNPNDGSGGNTRTQWNLSGDMASFVVRDDPGDSFTVGGGGTQFNTAEAWIACCTDGFAIGALEGSWEMLGQFLTTPTGISGWAAVNNDFSSTALVLAPGRRVRFDVASGPSQVPSPGPLALLGLGLAAIGGYRRLK